MPELKQNIVNSVWTHTDPFGNRTEYSYNEDGYIVRAETCGGAWDEYYYDNENNIIGFATNQGTPCEYLFHEGVLRVYISDTKVLIANDQRELIYKKIKQGGNITEKIYF
jgi:YD repeat-containing protein